MDKIQDKFLHEASELIDALESAVLALEKEPRQAEAIEQVFRVMHTFKGTAKMFGFDRIGEFTHYLENIYDDIRSKKLNMHEEVLEITFQSVDHIRQLLADPEEKDAALAYSHTQLLNGVKKISQNKVEEHVVSHESLAASVSTLFLVRFKPNSNFIKTGNNPIYLLEDLTNHGLWFIKTYTDRLANIDTYTPDQTYLYWDIFIYTSDDESKLRDEFMFVEDDCELEIINLGENNALNDTYFKESIAKCAETPSVEFVKSLIQANKETLVEQVANLNPTGKSPQVHLPKAHAIKVTYDKIDKLMGLVSELVTTQARLSLYADIHKTPEMEEIAENVEKLVRQLRDEAFSISLLPVSHLKMRFERLVRDTAKSLHKKVRFISEGDDTELDKKIIENLVDPLLHIIRNSIGHGLELPEERIRKGKKETGTILLKSYYSGTNVIIEITDDGAGINQEKVLEKALKRGLIAENSELSEKDIFDLIFQPGFSTASEITDVSGRGVGMDVVRQAVHDMRGEIVVMSEKDQGSTIRLILPLSLSIIDGLLVEIEGFKYVLPLSVVDKCYEMEFSSIKPDMNDLIVLDGEQVPYINLRQVFGHTEPVPNRINLVVAKYENKRVAVQVDAIVDEYQAVIKPLGKMYKHQDFASGATILGNGRVALVLDVNRLLTLV